MFLRNVASLLSVSFTVALYAKAQLAGQTVQIQTIISATGNNNCLTATSNADGAPVVIESCTNVTALNSWIYPQGEGVVGTIRIFGDKCLDVTNGAKTDGTKLQIWTCASGNTNQMWLPAGEDSTITWSGKNKCVDMTDGNLTDGNKFKSGTATWGTTTRNGISSPLHSRNRSLSP
ncbi:ricin B lectin domain-containing protein [Mycena capillaripes]|nr:ricin B lectin domain-containing protein [Mycena capillaripes]